MTRLSVRAHDVFCLYPTPRGHVAALRGLTLDLAAGERVVVHGPNGSGKTTLMRVLIGELAPSAGTVDVCGLDLAGAAEGERTRLRGRRIGLVDQHHGRSLRSEISVLDNVALQLRLAGLRRSAARAKAQALLDRLGLAHLGPRLPVTLSGGEAQRAAVCAAVAHSPDLVLADEPTGELDQATADEVYDLLAAAAADAGAALLVVSHDARATRIADRIVRIRDGRLSEEWRPEDAGAESLVVDDRGWVRLPEPLRRKAGVIERARATMTGDSIVLTPSPAPAEVGGPGAAAVDASGPASIGVESPARTSAEPAAHLSAESRARTNDEVARLEQVGADRGDRRVLDGVDLSLRAGTLTVVQGRSGSGKTTLLRILCGLERPDRGAVHVTGIDLAELDRDGLAALRRRSLGVAGQGIALLETMTAEENLDLVRVARRLPHDGARTYEWINALGLDAVSRRPVRVLSGGERQRVAVARVLAVEPRIAVLDEPTSHQDEAHAELVVAAVVAAARRGIAVIVATHDPVLVSAADTVLTLS